MERSLLSGFSEIYAIIPLFSLINDFMKSLSKSNIQHVVLKCYAQITCLECLLKYLILMPHLRLSDSAFLLGSWIIVTCCLKCTLKSWSTTTLRETKQCLYLGIQPLLEANKITPRCFSLFSCLSLTPSLFGFSWFGMESLFVQAGKKSTENILCLCDKFIQCYLKCTLKLRAKFISYQRN